MLKIMLKKNCAQSIITICIQTFMSKLQLIADNVERLFYQGVFMNCSEIPYGDFCLRGPNLCKLCGIRTMGLHILILQLLSTHNQPLLLCVTALCLVVSYVIKVQILSESQSQLSILAIVMTVQHFNRHSVIKLYHHPYEGVIIGS